MQDYIGAFIEAPKFENKVSAYINSNDSNQNLQIYDDYIMEAWEPGFLDNQIMLVFDEKDTLRKGEKIRINEGKLYPYQRIRSKIYLCVLER